VALVVTVPSVKGEDAIVTVTVVPAGNGRLLSVIAAAPDGPSNESRTVHLLSEDRGRH